MTDSTAYHSHYPCNDGSGTPADIAKSTTMTVGSAASAGLFANTGWITTATSENAGTPHFCPSPFPLESLMCVEELIIPHTVFFVPCENSIVSQTSACVCTRSGSSLGTGAIPA